MKMSTFSINKCLKPFKRKNIVAFSSKAQALLKNHATLSCAQRIFSQKFGKQNAHHKTSKGWGRHGESFQREGNLSLCGFYSVTRQFHGGTTSVIFQREKKPESLQELVEMESTETTQTAVTVRQKVAQAGKDVSYFAVILVGFAVTGALLWYVFSELFLSNSPNKIYADALKKVKYNEEVVDALGEPIKAYGEETSRGRRRHVSFQEYIVAGENYMRVKFYVSGALRKGTVHVDVKQVSPRRYEYRFIFVELEGFPPRTIIIEDNRLETD